MRPAYQIVLSELRLLEKLRNFHPVVIGTPPLEIDVETSDIDIACSSEGVSSFCETVKARFPELFVKGKHMNVRGEPTACAKLRSHGWDIELFCQGIAVERQWGVRHFVIERRLLNLAPYLRSKVRKLKNEGVKTEPAFARVLQLTGDPYEAMLQLETMADDELVELASRSI
ncbi:DUF4269 domain-containing protein [Halomonadaceae bacterium KBTZ08]